MGVLLLFACLSILIFVLCLLFGGSHGWIRTARSSSFRLDLFKVLDNYRGGPHMRSLISIDFLAPEMEPESAHVASAVSVP